jgi:uncharacterized membrane protein YgcG
MTTLMEELRQAVREILQSMGLDGSANTAATVVPVLMLGIALNVIALGVVDRVHPIKGKTQVVGVVRAEATLVRSVTVCVLRQIEGRRSGLCSVKRWASSRLAERVKCRTASGSGRAAAGHKNGFAFPCGDRSYPMGAGKKLWAI